MILGNAQLVSGGLKTASCLESLKVLSSLYGLQLSVDNSKLLSNIKLGLKRGDKRFY